MGDGHSENPGCLFSFLRIFAGRPAGSGDEELPYRLRDDFLSPAEQSFYRVLAGVVADKAIICPKVRVADILFVIHRQQNMAHVNRINRKHVDFLLCDKGSLRPRLVIELDDASHNRPDRMDRDTLIDAAFRAAGLPVAHVPAQRAYSSQDLAALVAEHLDAARRQPSSGQAVAVSPAKTAGRVCPKCGVPMVVRVSRKGDRAGGQFYGCPNFPHCRETAPL